MAAQDIPLPEGAGGDRNLAAANRAGGCAIRRARDRNRRMRRPHQGLRRCSGNYDQIVRHVVMPALADGMPVRQAIDGITGARAAALLDPEGEALAKCLAALPAPPAHAIAAE